MKQYENQFEFNRDFKVIGTTWFKKHLIGQLVNYPKVRAKGFNIQDLECNLEDALTDYLMQNDCVDFKTRKPKIY